MALMFSRLAHNFIKNGYFPTDEKTLAGVLAAIAPAAQAARIHDPCAGEGTALADIKHHLQTEGAQVQALGIEFDGERAAHAKRLVDVAIHSDNADVILTRRSCGLLFLNPPYGDSVADQAGTGDAGRKERLEFIFLKRAYDSLQIGGLLVLIVPFYVLDESMATFLARHFTQVDAYLAPEPRFKQCVIFGVRRRAGHPTLPVVEQLLQMGEGALAERILPAAWPRPRYEVPAAPVQDDFRFHALRIDAPQLQGELERLRTQTLWPQFSQVFVQVTRPPRPPLRALSRWHLALALAAGQITGAVRSNDGRQLYIKGDTYKDKVRSVETSVNDDGDISETVTLTDRFVPIIRGIDLTPGPGLGAIVTIR